MFRKPTDDQQEVLDALDAGRFTKERQTTQNISYYITHGGIPFRWVHGFGSGKDVKIFDVKQPEWFARKVRKALTV